MKPDYIIDRMRLHKQLANWRLLAIFTSFVLVVLFYISGEKHAPSVIDGQHIARISINGPIMYNTYDFEKIKALQSNKSIKAIILHINSPGGSVAGSEALYNSLRKLSSSNKPMVAVMEEFATSGGYMAALAADYIVAYNSTLTGSIGVISTGLEVTELAEKLGVTFYNFKSSPLKGGPSMEEKLTPEMRLSIEGLVKEMYVIFCNIVSTRRGIPMNKLSAIADGRSYTGTQALKLGLIDAIGDEDVALQWLKNHKKIDQNLKIFNYKIVNTQDSFHDMLNVNVLIDKLINSLSYIDNLKFYSH